MLNVHNEPKHNDLLSIYIKNLYIKTDYMFQFNFMSNIMLDRGQ